MKRLKMKHTMSVSVWERAKARGIQRLYTTKTHSHTAYNTSWNLCIYPSTHSLLHRDTSLLYNEMGISSFDIDARAHPGCVFNTQIVYPMYWLCNRDEMIYFPFHLPLSLALCTLRFYLSLSHCACVLCLCCLIRVCSENITLSCSRALAFSVGLFHISALFFFFSTKTHNRICCWKEKRHQIHRRRLVRGFDKWMLDTHHIGKLFELIVPGMVCCAFSIYN